MIEMSGSAISGVEEHEYSRRRIIWNSKLRSCPEFGQGEISSSDALVLGIPSLGKLYD
jgi:hypothetical protein